MLGDLIYEAKGKIIYTKVISTKPITFEGSYVADGKLRGNISIKEHCTFISEWRSNNIVYGEGKHVIITPDGTVTWVGRGFGKKVDDKQIWRGSGIFSSSIESFNDMIGVVEAEIDGDMLEIKVWEWL